MSLPTLHIYPAFGAGSGTPRVYTFTVFPDESIADAVRRSVALGDVPALSRDDVFDTVFYPSVRARFADIIVHQDMLHPSM